MSRGPPPQGGPLWGPLSDTHAWCPPPPLPATLRIRQEQLRMSAHTSKGVGTLLARPREVLSGPSPRRGPWQRGSAPATAGMGCEDPLAARAWHGFYTSFSSCPGASARGSTGGLVAAAKGSGTTTPSCGAGTAECVSEHPDPPGPKAAVGPWR